MKCEIIMAQFGERAEELEPALSSYREYFPDAAFTLYTDADAAVDGVSVRVVDSPFDRQHPRYGYRSNDFFKVVGALEADSRFAIAIDTDTVIVHKNVNTIFPLMKRFGVCIPCNPRQLVGIDTIIGTDSDGMFDDSLGTGYAVNMTPIALDREHKGAVSMLQSYVEIMTQTPVRGPLAMWRAMWVSGFFPCLLPPQWCVCTKFCGCGNEIILHTGHDKVREHYGV